MLTLIITSIGALLIIICIFLSVAMIKAFVPAEKPTKNVIITIASMGGCFPSDLHIPPAPAVHIPGDMMQMAANIGKAMREAIERHEKHQAEMQVKY